MLWDLDSSFEANWASWSGTWQTVLDTGLCGRRE